MNSKHTLEKKEYVELLSKALEPLVDFGSVEYMTVYSTGAEYLKVMDSIGSAKYMDVTSQDMENILIEVLRLVVSEQSTLQITKKESCRAVASLFKKGNDDDSDKQSGSGKNNKRNGRSESVRS